MEAAYEFLISQGYTVLYTQRNKPVKLLNGDEIVINHGPDILATRVINNQTQLFVVEVKGGVNKTLINRSRLRSTAGGVKVTQPERAWVVNDADVRYLNALTNAKDPKLQTAAQEISKVRGGRKYGAIVVGAGPNPTWGKVDQMIGEIVTTNPQIPNAASLQVVKIAR